MEIYRVNLRIQFEYRKIRTRKNSVVGHFSRSEWVWDYMWLQVTMGWNKRNSKWLEVITYIISTSFYICYIATDEPSFIMALIIFGKSANLSDIDLIL